VTITKGGQPAEESPAPAAGGGNPDGTEDARRSRRARGRDPRISAMTLSGLLALGLGVTAAVLPVPYVVESPGPTFNTLGTENTKPVISVSGRETFPAKGNLDLTTVYVDGGPNGPVSVFEAFSAWLDGSKAVYPRN
jgi:PDZ domain-containing protein